MRTLSVAIAALALAALPGCGRPTPPRDVNLVIVSFDTLRADRLGAYGNTEWGESPSPVVDQLAEQGVVLEHMYVPRGQTHPALASLLTGKYPITHGLRENGFPLPASHRTLFQELWDAGYQTGVFASNLEVSIEEWAYRGSEQQGDGYQGKMRLEAPNESRYQRIWDDRVEQGALQFLDQVDRSRPFALWVHFYDVHKPYTPPPEAQGYGLGDDVPEELIKAGAAAGPRIEQHLARITLTDKPVTDAELARIRGLYDGGVKSTDARLGRLLDKLATLGELDDSYVVLTSDHGEELFDHNRYFFHGASIYNGVVTVPFIIRGPDLDAGIRIDVMTQNLDVAPTILDLLQLPVPDDIEGGSLAPLLRGQSSDGPADYAFIEWQDLIYAVSDGRHKLIWNPEHTWTRKLPYGAPGVPRQVGFRIDCLEGYDLQADPREQVNLLADFDLTQLRNGDGLPPEFQPLFKALRRWLADPEHQRRLKDNSLSQEQLKRLEQLGYLGVSEGRGDSVKKAPCIER